MGVPLSTGAKVAVSVVAMAEVGGGTGMPDVRCDDVRDCLRTCKEIHRGSKHVTGADADPGDAFIAMGWTVCKDKCTGCSAFCDKLKRETATLAENLPDGAGDTADLKVTDYPVTGQSTPFQDTFKQVCTKRCREWICQY